MFSSQNSQVSSDANYIEDVFQTWLYTGNGSTQTITNGIDLSTKGGLVWLKSRNQAYDHTLIDTVRGSNKVLYSNATVAEATNANVISAFSSTGFTTPGTSTYSGESGTTYASWTFRKQPKFFDVVTYTGNAAARTIAHSLGSVPGSIWIKRTDSTSNWAVYHRQLGTDQGYTGKDFHIWLNLTNAQDGISDYWNQTAPTSTVFSLGANAAVNTNGATYVAYVFAHDAGGFGLTGTDNVISCGSYTGTGAAQDVTLGYEPQFLIIKNASAATNWVMLDNMRGLPVGTGDAYLKPNLSDQEVSTSDFVDPTATGFRTILSTMNTSGNLYIYIAIRRGPMKVPTSGTSVLGLNARTGTGANATVTGLAPTDLIISKRRQNAGFPPWGTRLSGFTYLSSSNTTAEISGTSMYQNPPFDVQNGVKIATASNINSNGETYINYLFGRAPSFMDVVCYTGDGNNPRTINHNLGAAPELMIIKRRNASGEDWSVYCAYMSSPETSVLFLNLTNAQDSGTGRWNNTAPTSTVFSLAGLNTNGGTYVAYLFATCAGVSKVGSYTGTGTTKQIDCGFTGGARFVLIKRTDSTGDWYVWDTARGIVSGNDPYLLLNSTAAEVTNTDYIDTYSAGFEISSTAPAAINASGGTFIFLAIA